MVALLAIFGSELTVLGEDPFLIRGNSPRALKTTLASTVGADGSPTANSALAPPSGFTASALHCNKTLLSLGCLLFELVSNEKHPGIFQHSTPVGSSSVGIDLGSASLPQHIAAHRELARCTLPSDNYRGAVSRCLQGDLHKPGRGLDTEDACQEVYAGVVALLERDLDNT